MTKFFKVIAKDKKTRARAGIINTAHGKILTPCFMAVGTAGSVKALDSRDLEELKAPIILTNTYHLALRPGTKEVMKLGRIHKFMNWPGPVLTDSGGFQVFSLNADLSRLLDSRFRGNDTMSSSGLTRGSKHGRLVKIDNRGVTFRSHLDGSLHRFTPKSAIEMQNQIGADIIMAFDECTPDTASKGYARQAMERTHQWAKQSLGAHKKSKFKTPYPQYLFGIIQGGAFKDLRRESAQFIIALPFDGIAIGGESVGFNMKRTKKILTWIQDLLPEDKPRYTMGVGFSPLDCFEVVEQGIDMFDCVAPTRVARNGTLFTRQAGRKNKFRIDITTTKFKMDQTPIDLKCSCFTCQNYPRAYLHHLFRSRELLAYRLATIHNLHFFLRLMENIRKSIKNGKFQALKTAWSK